MNSDGSRRVQLTSTPGQDVCPRVTADGKYIVFVSDRDGGLRAVADGARRQRCDPPVGRSCRASARERFGGRQVGLLQRTSSVTSRKVSIDGGAPVPCFLQTM